MKIMIIGTTGAGKTTIIQSLRKQMIEWQKTQTITYLDDFIDVPGEYLDIPRFHRAIIVTAMDTDLILLVQPADSEKQNIPPSFASIFNQPVIGIISKIDLPGGDVGKAEDFLRLAGVSGPIVAVSAINGEGINKLIKVLEQYDWRKN